MAMITPERDLEEALVSKLKDLKYEYRPDVRDRASLERNFREKFEILNRVTLTDGEFQRLLDGIVTHDVFRATGTLRERNSFTREDGTPLNYMLVNIKDWCKNSFEVVNLCQDRLQRGAAAAGEDLSGRIGPAGDRAAQGRAPGPGRDRGPGRCRGHRRHRGRVARRPRHRAEASAL
ncbi:MAG: type restriction enzyme subunit [Bradyrhizobium sp.]|nr:type restriction enzyme subunit [Bradyrhizobium sp.]